MNKSIVVSIFFLLLVFTCQSQDTWTTIKIDRLGSIDLPPNMEIQGGAYRAINDKIKEINGVSASKVIFQQKNLNSGTSKSFETYARVFIRTEKGTSGEYQKLKNFSLSASEVKEVNDAYKSEIYGSAAAANATILEWYPASMSTLNGYKCLTMGYKRKVGSNSPTLSTLYFFQNYNRMHILTFEYRIADASTWQTTFNQIKNSLTIKEQ